MEENEEERRGRGDWETGKETERKIKGDDRG
jgi:hypothetical protein